MAQNEAVDEEYPPPFVTTFNAEISKTLVKNNIKGCGILKYRASKRPQDKEFLVLCSNNGEQWTAYFVWVYTGKVMGPMSPEPNLK